MPFVISISRVALLLTILMGCLAGTRSYADDVIINKNYPIRNPAGGSNLSPPNVEATNECATAVYVDSFVPHATISVFLNGSTVIGGPLTSEFGFAAINLTHPLHTGDKVTATQTVNGVKSNPSAPMLVGAMPSKLDAPVVGKAIYACGRIVPVTGLTSGVQVEVRDDTANATIGTGATPNLWGNDWDPVVTSKLTAGHAIIARQSACTGIKSPFSVPPFQLVNTDPSPVTTPVLDPPVVGNDAVTAHDLLTGSDLQVFDHTTQIGGGLTTAATNWAGVSPKIAATGLISADQVLCAPSAKSPPVKPVSSLKPPTLVGPICPGQGAAIVGGSTINATLVLLKNTAVSGYGGAGPGDVALNIAAPAVFAQNDKVRVAEYIGNIVALSNTVIVGCHDVITYHNDNGRTGWNAQENTLTPANVTMSTFGLIATANLDDDNDQVDAQPLIVTNQAIEGMGVHSVAYLATENNSVYAIDSFTGTKLKKVTLGTPVPRPLSCENNGPAVGIDSTPTIDRKTGTLYVIAYVMKGTTPVHELHALDLATLNDKHPPTTIAATNTLVNGTAYQFDSSVQRQRPALLQVNGNVYAGFGSYCDFKASASRGWVLGWQQSTLALLGKTELLNKSTATSNFDCYFHAPWPNNHPCYLSSVWMSGFGLASDAQGNLFFTTGNTGEGFYNSTANIAESMVKLSADLSTVVDFFTPANVNALDAGDTDFGSGGTLVLPDQTGPMPHLAVAAGKDGNLYIVNRDTGKMGEFRNPNVPASVPISGDCHCGPSYFKGADGVGRIVSSGGTEIIQWKVNTANTPALGLEAQVPVTSGQDGAAFTSISSNGTTAKTAIIWTVGRPVSNANTHVTLQAFDATPAGGVLKSLWSNNAGTWPNTGGNANIVPTVANGMVYVASYKQLQIFGLIRPTQFGKRMTQMAFDPEVTPQSFTPETGPLHWGTIRAVDGSRITLALRTGRTLIVDVSRIMPQATSDFGAIGRHLAVGGTVGSDGVLAATGIWRVKNPAFFGPDRDN
jgi:hypothetical protein